MDKEKNQAPGKTIAGLGEEGADLLLTYQQRIDLADTYIKVERFEQAEALLADLLDFEECAGEAAYRLLLIRHRVRDLGALANKLSGWGEQDTALLEKIRLYANEALRDRVCHILCLAARGLAEEKEIALLGQLLAVDFQAREACITQSFDHAIEAQRYGAFAFLLSACEENWELCKEKLLQYAKASKDAAQRKACLERVLERDPENKEVARLLVRERWKASETDAFLEGFAQLLEGMPKKEADREVQDFLKDAAEATGLDAEHAAILVQVMKSYVRGVEGALAAIPLLNRLLKQHLFDEAGEVASFLLSFLPNESKLYWALILVRAKASNEKELCSSEVLLTDIPEYTKYLAMVDEPRRLQCMELEKKQQDDKKQKRNLAIFCVGFCALLIGVLLFMLLALPRIQYNNGEYASYINLHNISEFEVPEGTTTIKASAFKGANDLEVVRIPDSVKTIEDYAFEGCEKLKEITIPDSVTKIGDFAFRGCSSLTSITIPDSVTEIGAYAFSSCSGLTSITIPDSVITIGESACEGCDSLQTMTVPFLGKSGYGYFSYFFGEQTNKTIPSSLTHVVLTGDYPIQKNAFENCSYIQSIVISGSVPEIGIGAFRECERLRKINIPNSVKEISKSTFYGCSELNSITIPDSVTKIGEDAFSGCSRLTSITIPDSVRKIGDRAFSRCNSLGSVIFENPRGWSNEELPIYEGQLANPTMAADYLKSHNTSALIRQ